MTAGLHCFGCDEAIPRGEAVAVRDGYFCRQCGFYQAALAVGPLLDEAWTPTPGTYRERGEAADVVRYLLRYVEARLRRIREEYPEAVRDA